MSVSALDDLFFHDLKDVYDAERRLVGALGKMAEKATSDELQAAFEEHAGVTEEHVQRLEQIFKSLGKPARGKKCLGMEGLVNEGKEVGKEVEAGPALDAALIGAAQKIEHYEIAAYGTLVTYARLLQMDEAVELLEQTLAEEKETDQKLTSLASDINLEAEEDREESSAE